MAYTVYVIKSQQKDWFYVGLTADLNRRLTQHNSGQNRSTKPYLPFQLIMTEAFDNRLEARKREKELKSTSGKRFIRKYFSRFEKK